MERDGEAKIYREFFRSRVSFDFLGIGSLLLNGNNHVLFWFLFSTITHSQQWIHVWGLWFSLSAWRTRKTGCEWYSGDHLFYVYFHVFTFLMRKDASWLQHCRCLSFTVQNSTFALREHKRRGIFSADLVSRRTRKHDLTVLQLVWKSVTISGLCMGVLETHMRHMRMDNAINSIKPLFNRIFTPILDKLRWRCRLI